MAENMISPALVSAIDAYKAGNKTAFEGVYRECSRYVYTIANKIFGDDGSAYTAQVMQSTFDDLAAGLGRLANVNLFWNILASITIQKCYSIIVGKDPRALFVNESDYDENLALDDVYMPTSVFQDAMERNRMEDLYALELTEFQKLCLIANSGIKLSVSDIANRLGIQDILVGTAIAVVNCKMKRALQVTEGDSRFQSAAPWVSYFFQEDVATKTVPVEIDRAIVSKYLNIERIVPQAATNYQQAMNANQVQKAPQKKSNSGLIILFISITVVVVCIAAIVILLLWSGKSDKKEEKTTEATTEEIIKTEDTTAAPDTTTEEVTTAEATEEETTEEIGGASESRLVSVDGIPADTLEEMKEKAETKVQKNVDETWNSKYEEFKGMKYQGSLFLYTKEATDEPDNKLILVYKMSVNNKSVGKSFDYYWYIEYDNIEVDEDGYCNVNMKKYVEPDGDTYSYERFDVGNGYYYYGYSDTKSIIKYKVEPYLDDYDYEDRLK